ncbi:MAG: trypsin-like peptidase domain-containing protein [Thermoproteota archaeon]|nr:trypsin-like peptidase domain-containing protein [Thermoproteota archaeon]
MVIVSVRKTNSLIISSALSIVLLTITLSIMLSSNHHFLPNSSAQAQTFANNTDSVIIPNNIRLNFSELFTRVESSVLQVTDPSAPGLLGPRLGSGFVYDKEGHIITNNHVVAGGSGDLDITFNDGTVYDARLVGSDPYADLAVLKVEEGVPKDKLVPLPLGNSSTLKIGQPVAAVGSPFGLSGSITEGIISGLGRSLPSSVPQDPTIPQLDVPSLPAPPAFSIPDIIQTDAAINPGNSGGPLLNMGGEVVGINTAIFSNTGSYSGVGFAIPSNMIKKVVTSLIATGSYTHPYIGITGLDITPEVAEAMGLQEARGFLVTDVTAEGPAAKAGVQGGDLLADINGREIDLGGDVILEIDNKTVRKIDDILTYLEREKQVGDTVQLTVLRDGQLQQIPVTLAARPALSQQPQLLAQSPDQPSLGILGIDITPEIAEAIGLQEARGFLVTDVIKGGPSDKAGIRGGYIIANINGTEIELGGDVILEIDNETVRTINDILTYLNTQKKVGDTVQLTVLRDGQVQQIPVTLAAISTLPEFANPEAPLQPDESLPAPPSPPPSQPPDRDGLFGNLYDECIKMASKEICDLLFNR